MKKLKNTLIIIFFICTIISILISCNGIDYVNTDYSWRDTVLQDTSASIVDTTIVKAESDSVFNKMNDLFISTENSDKKITEIKSIKKENTCLKKELVETKQELNQAKEQIKKMEDTLKYSNQKKGFLRKVIDNLKGDSTSVEAK